jgi:hypothetical protein
MDGVSLEALLPDGQEFAGAEYHTCLLFPWPPSGHYLVVEHHWGLGTNACCDANEQVRTVGLKRLVGSRIHWGYSLQLMMTCP